MYGVCSVLFRTTAYDTNRHNWLRVLRRMCRIKPVPLSRRKVAFIHPLAPSFSTFGSFAMAQYGTARRRCASSLRPQIAHHYCRIRTGGATPLKWCQPVASAPVRARAPPRPAVGADEAMPAPCSPAFVTVIDENPSYTRFDIEVSCWPLRASHCAAAGTCLLPLPL